MTPAVGCSWWELDGMVIVPRFLLIVSVGIFGIAGVASGGVVCEGARVEAAKSGPLPARFPTMDCLF